MSLAHSESPLQVQLNENETRDLEKRLQSVPLRKAAQHILALSDFFQSGEEKRTPWQNADLFWAYETYFHPLNKLRLQGVQKRIQELSLELPKNIIDFGCGLGAASEVFAAKDSEAIWMSDANETLLAYLRAKKSKSVQILHPKKLIDEFSFQQKRKKTSTLLILSYSLNEMIHEPDWKKLLTLVDWLLIVEPSTRQASRHLLDVRKELQLSGWSIEAPCTHQGECPLMASKQDWCHDRFHWKQPSFWTELESLLPMKNKTLTASYLLCRKGQATKQKSQGRLIGDLLVEKGRSRILLCEDAQKKWLQFLHRNGPTPSLFRGNLWSAKDMDPKI